MRKIALFLAPVVLIFSYINDCPFPGATKILAQNIPEKKTGTTPGDEKKPEKDTDDDSDDDDDDINVNKLINEAETDESKFKHVGKLNFIFDTTRLESGYISNLSEIKKDGNYRGEIRPDATYKSKKFKVFLKPRLSLGTRTQSRKQTQTSSESIGKFSFYEAFFTYQATHNSKLEAGFIDHAGGFGNIYNPGNIWKSSNNTSNPTQENESELSVIYTIGINDWFTVKLIGDSDYVNTNYRLASPSNSDTPPSDFVLDTSDLDDVYKDKIENSFTERYETYDFYGTRYSDKSLAELRGERALYGGGKFIFDFPSFEIRLFAKAASGMPAIYGGQAAITIKKALLLYGEGSVTRGRNAALSVETGQEDRFAAIGEDPWLLRATNPEYRRIDRAEDYDLIFDKEYKTYEFKYNNRAYTRQALGGLQYTLPGFPLTLNLEYIFDGNGYTREEYKNYNRGLYWAALPALGRISNEVENESIYFTRFQSYLQNKDNLTLSQASSVNGLAYLENEELPARFGQHYAMLQLQYQVDSGEKVIFYRMLLNLQDRSVQNLLYGKWSINDSWSVFGIYVYNSGREHTEYNSLLVDFSSFGVIYSW